MFTKILIANRSESWLCQLRRNQSGREANVSAKPNCMARVAHAGEFSAENQHV